MTSRFLTSTTTPHFKSFAWRGMPTAASDGRAAHAVLLKPIQQLQRHEAIFIAPDHASDVILQSSWCVPKHGRSESVQYDFIDIEKEMQLMFVTDKVCFQVDADDMDYVVFDDRGEVFSYCPNLLAATANQISQVDLDTTRVLAVQQHLGRAGNAPRVLSVLDVLLYVLKKSNITDPSITLQQFASTWLPGQEQTRVLAVPAFQGMQLSHVVSLYEAVEESFASVAARNVHESYTTVLSPDLRTRVLEMVQAGVSAGALACVLRRFLLRHCLVANWPPNNQLVTYIYDLGLIRLPHDVVRAGVDFEAVFPMELLLKHVYEVYCLLSDIEKQSTTTQTAESSARGAQQQLTAASARPSTRTEAAAGLFYVDNLTCIGVNAMVNNEYRPFYVLKNPANVGRIMLEPQEIMMTSSHLVAYTDAMRWTIIDSKPDKLLQILPPKCSHSLMGEVDVDKLAEMALAPVAGPCRLGLVKMGDEFPEFLMFSDLPIESIEFNPSSTTLKLQRKKDYKKAFAGGDGDEKAEVEKALQDAKNPANQTTGLQNENFTMKVSPA
eukprot:jgi/Chlat1/7598/Chrsp64S07093